MINEGIKQRTILIVAMCLLLFTGAVQAKDMYLMKNGAVVLKQSLAAADVDSIVYYEPAHALTTTAVTAIGLTTATSGGNIAAYDGATVTARGVCWSTATQPTIALSTKTSDGTGTGLFTSALTGLSGSTKYYVRAYATNGSGVTSYGEEVSFTTNPYVIGDLYLGGKIAYIDDSGIHGFVCALTDQSTGIRWHNGIFITTGATNTVLETTGVYGITKSGGRKNTDAIILKQGEGSYAASICAALTTGDATAGEWYLPSKGELNQLYVNRLILGGFASDYYYWSSSEVDKDFACIQDFSDGGQGYGTKGIKNYVRAVRAF